MSANAAIFNPTESTSAATGDGFSVPRLTTTGRLAITFGTGDKGMMVYDTTLNNLFIWNGSAWESVPASGDAGANGDVQYNDNGIIAGASGFFWDKANNRVGIGIAAPNRNLTLFASSSPVLQLCDSTTGTTSNDGLLIQQVGVDTFIENAEIGSMFLRTSATTRATLDPSGNLGLGGTPTATTKFVCFNGATQAMTLDTSGNLLVGTTSQVGRLTVRTATDNTTVAQFGATNRQVNFTTNAISTVDNASFNFIHTGGSGRFTFQNNNGTLTMLTIDDNGNNILRMPVTPPTLNVDYEGTFNLTSNTNLRISVRGSDGVTRVANITLA